jgi:hypothetical protein
MAWPRSQRTFSCVNSGNVTPISPHVAGFVAQFHSLRKFKLILDTTCPWSEPFPALADQEGLSPG